MSYRILLGCRHLAGAAAVKLLHLIAISNHITERWSILISPGEFRAGLFLSHEAEL